MSPTNEDDLLSHAEVSDLLHAYANHILLGERPEVVYPAVSTHLATCAACRADLNEMLQVTRAAVHADGAMQRETTPPDLSRLPRPWQQDTGLARPWFIDRIGRLWLELSEELLRAWRPSPLLGAARGALLYAYQDARPDPLMAPDREDMPALSVDIRAETDPRTVLLQLTLDLPGNDALDQAGVPVVVYGAGTPRSGTTDAAGQVHFDQIPRDSLPGLRIEIKAGRST